MSYLPKWIHISFAVLLALLATCKAILICTEHQWGIIPIVIIAVVIFGLLYGIVLRGSFWLAEKITLAFAKAYKENIVPKIEMRAIERYIAEHPIKEPEPSQKSIMEAMNEHNQQLNVEERMHRFMMVCDKERELFIAKKKKEDEEKLEMIKTYVRKTLIPFGFTNEELYQVSECVTLLVVHKVVVPTLPIKIEKSGEKDKLTQYDLQNFGWNIAHQYNIEGMLTAQFVQYTFQPWFKGASTTNIHKRLKNTNAKYRIPIDENIFCDKSDDIQDG